MGYRHSALHFLLSSWKELCPAAEGNKGGYSDLLMLAQFRNGQGGRPVWRKRDDSSRTAGAFLAKENAMGAKRRRKWSGTARGSKSPPWLPVGYICSSDEFRGIGGMTAFLSGEESDSVWYR